MCLNKDLFDGVGVSPADTSSPVRRRYASPLRARQAEATRATLLRTATELITTRGWAATGMRDVARGAGVAVETLYKHYSSKRVLFDAVIDHAVAEARPGARFRGRNRQGWIRWGRLCEVVRAAPYELVWRTVPTRLTPDSTEWALRLTPVDGGTTIEQRYRLVMGTKLEVVYATIPPAHRDRTDALTKDLERIGALAARSGAGDERRASVLGSGR